MNEIRRSFLEVSRTSREVIADPAVAGAWNGPSALTEFSLRGLAGHLVRGTGSVEAYLDRDPPSGESVIDAAAYYAAAVADSDIHSALHTAVRVRGEEEAAGGHAALVDRLEGLIDRLQERLEREPADRRVRVFKDLVLTLDDYLATRLVELVVHIDDIAASIGIATPAVPDLAYRAVIDTLVGVARHRHGDLAVVRALARRERDAIEALRVL